MGIFNFFKKRKENTDINFSSEIVQFNELETWLQNKKSELTEKESDLLTQIKDQLNKLTKELEEEIEIIKQINLDNKPKIEERVKLIVKGNIENYTTHLNKLTETLKNLKLQSTTITDKINSIFSEFEKKSNLSYQKATFLVGEELEKTKKSIFNFFESLKNTLDKNKNLITLSKTRLIINEKLKEINEIEKQKTETQKNINLLNQKIQDSNNKINTLKKEIEETKKSQEYIEELKTKQTILNKEQELKKEILQLKTGIDFKSLANIFHTNKKEMNLIKEHKENFYNSFQKSNGNEILELLKDAKFDTQILSEKIIETNKIQQEIENLEKTFNPKYLENIKTKESEITKTKENIENINYENSREKNQYDKFNKTKQEIIGKIKQELGKISIELE